MEREVLDYASRLMDETSLRLIALLKGTVVRMSDIKPGSEITEVFTESCSDRLCFIRIINNKFEGSILVSDGYAVAAYLKKEFREILGYEALKELSNLLNEAGGSIVIYELPAEEVAKAYPDVFSKLAKPTYAPEEAVAGALPRDLGEKIIRELRHAGLTLSSVIVELAGDEVKVEVSWVEVISYLPTLTLYVIKELTSRGIEFKKLVLVSRVLSRESGRVVETRHSSMSASDMNIWRSLATVADAMAELGFLVDELNYKLGKDVLKLELSVVVPYGRISQMDSVYYRKLPYIVAEDILRKLTRVWKGRVEVRVLASIRTLQGYVEYEGRASSF